MLRTWITKSSWDGLGRAKSESNELVPEPFLLFEGHNLKGVILDDASFTVRNVEPVEVRIDFMQIFHSSWVNCSLCQWPQETTQLVTALPTNPEQGKIALILEIAAEKSFKAKLRAIAKEKNRDPADLWQNLTLERFLVRLAKSASLLKSTKF